MPAVQTATFLFEEDRAGRRELNQNRGRKHKERAENYNDATRQHDIENPTDEHQRFVCGRRTEGKQRETVEFMQFHARHRMREKIQNNSSRDAQFFAQQEQAGELIDALPIHHKDELIHPSTFQKLANFIAREYTQQLQTPNTMVFDRAREIVRRGAAANHCHIPHIERAVFSDFHQNDPIRYKKDVIDNQCEDNDRAVRLIRLHKGNRGGHHQAGKTDCFGQPADLGQGWQGQFGINPKQGHQHSPGWKDDCQNPQVYSNGHDGMSFQLEQRHHISNKGREAKTISQKEARRRQKQVERPQIDGKNSFSLINHASSR